MGTGTDLAMESAAVTLIRGDLTGIGKAIHLSKAVMRNIELIFDSRFFDCFQPKMGGLESAPPCFASAKQSHPSNSSNPRFNLRFSAFLDPILILPNSAIC